MEALRTPDDRFSSLPGHPFAPHDAEIADGEGGTLRVHHVDKGASGGRWFSSSTGSHRGATCTGT